MTTQDIHERLKNQCVFLTAYATQMLASGSTTVRIERNLHIMARAWQTHAEFSILPSHVVINLWDEERSQSYSSIGRVGDGAVNLSRVADLNRIADDVEKKHYTLDDARRDFEAIQGRPRMNRWVVTALVGVANASFCRLFGGDWFAMAVVWFATVDGFFLKNKLTEQRWDYRAVTVVTACVAAIITCVAYVGSLSSTPDVALATSVLFLVPGIPFGNAVNDLINGHYLCSLSRFVKATVITVCLSVGLFAALLLTNINM